MSAGWRLSVSQLRSRGDAAALRSVDATLTYRELADRTDEVVSTLRAGGIVPGEPVGLLFGYRGHVEPVALAATLCAGAVVVPLDPHSPASRSSAILRARGCRALLYDGVASPLVEALTGPQLLIRMDERGGIEGCAGNPHLTPVCTPTAACILHTSGTTGVPKAVPVEWPGLDAFTEWMVSLTELSAGDRVLRVSELIFDLAWFDHLATWRVGATLATIERRELVSARTIATRVAVLRPQVIYGVPSFFMKLVAGLPDGRALHPELRVGCFAGEVFPPQELLALAKRSGRARLINLFGPTETNVCTFHEVQRDRLDGSRELPIGIAPPYADCSLHAEDGGGVISGPGTGELVVAGPTALGGRFATGDRVERRADGLYYFRGRLDRMVKVRGYRVQPAEVESTLLDEPRIREAAVTVGDHPRLGSVLQGHVVLRHPDKAVEARELRTFVAERLPPYMVPQRIEVLSALPRTSTGKIDYPRLAGQGARSARPADDEQHEHGDHGCDGQHSEQ